MSEYVQHTSGEGKKWKVANETSQRWIVYPQDEMMGNLDLPKSEYRLVAPPERWVDVTEQCEDRTYRFYHHEPAHPLIVHDGAIVTHEAGYRLRKVQLYTMGHSAAHQQWAFLVERREP